LLLCFDELPMTAMTFGAMKYRSLMAGSAITAAIASTMLFPSLT
jgi:hypothetical protein